LRVSLVIFNCWWDVTLGPTMGRTNHWLTTICCTDEHRSMQLQSSCSWLQSSSHWNTSGRHSQTNSSSQHILAMEAPYRALYECTQQKVWAPHLDICI
jgi:hypothetical protein